MRALDKYGRLVDAAGHLVDTELGVLRMVSEIPREAGAPDFFHFAGESADTAAFVRQENFNITGGAATTRHAAAAKAIGEAVERYCSAIFDIRELPLYSYDEAPVESVAPADFDWYSPAQFDSPGFQFVPFTERTPVRWTDATDLSTGARVRLPACTVFLPYTYYRGDGDSPLVQPISTGLSCHCSPEEALVGAITEVVERDSFTLFWQAMLQPPRILTESLPDSCYELVARFERCGGKVVLLDITTDARIPSVLSILRHPHPDCPPLVFAASSDLSPEVAARKSLEELAHTGRYMQQIKTHLERLEPDPEYRNVADQVSHLNFWCDRSNAALADFAFASRERVEFDELEDRSTGSPRGDIDQLVRLIGDCGHRVYAADLTSEDIEPLGLSVVRAAVPGFHALFMDHRYRSLGCARRWEVPPRLGRAAHPDREWGNPVPHPYP